MTDLLSDNAQEQTQTAESTAQPVSPSPIETSMQNLDEPRPSKLRDAYKEIIEKRDKELEEQSKEESNDGEQQKTESKKEDAPAEGDKQETNADDKTEKPAKKITRRNERIRQLVDEKNALLEKLKQYESKEQLNNVEAAQYVSLNEKFDKTVEETRNDIQNYIDTEAIDKASFLSDYASYKDVLNKQYPNTIKVIMKQDNPWLALECFMAAERNGAIELDSFCKQSIPRQESIIRNATNNVIAMRTQKPNPAPAAAAPPAEKPKIAPSIVPNESRKTVSEDGDNGSYLYKLIQDKKAGLRR